MSKKYRLIFMMLSIVVLLTIGYITNHSLEFVFNDLWFTSGLLLLVLLSLIDQPFFSKDSNIFVNAITAGLSLLLIPKDERTILFWCFTGVTLYLVISSYTLMWLRRYELSQENKIIQFITRFNRQLGRPETLFSAFFLWSAVRQYGLNSSQFNALLLYWAVFMILNLPSVSKAIEGVFTSKKANDTLNIVGRIFGVQSKNTFLVKLSENRKRTLKRFDCVEFLYSIDRHEHKGIVLDVYWLDQEQWIKVLTTAEIDGLFEKTVSKYEPDYVYKTDTSVENDFLKRFIGLVYDNSNIERIRFSYNAKIEVMNGQLVELTVNNHKVLYQIVQGITKSELLENKNETSFIIGEAIQLGEWNIEKGRFERFGWVPSINTPLFIASCIPEQSIENNEYIIGNIPNTNYPVILNKELAVTHHTAVLGITGSGKSVFTRNLIKQIANDQTRVIIVDFTGEYKDRIPNLVSIVDEGDVKVIADSINDLTAENAKYPDKRNQSIISKSIGTIETKFRLAIKRFLEGTNCMGVFELTEIMNSASNLEYTRWFFLELFNTAKDNGNFGKKVCVVLEEAHTIVPETTSMGVSDNASKATVNSIAQIALQGRKYNIGFIVIAQRTANVSKTILTQCNSVVVFQELDKTTSDFLSNYMGQSFVDILPTLKNRTAIAMGKAFRSNAPMIFEVPEISEDQVP